MDMRVHVGGDAESGWSVDIHDGTNHGVYSPEAVDAHEALDKAYAMHTEAFPKDGNEYDGKARATTLAALDQRLTEGLAHVVALDGSVRTLSTEVAGVKSDVADLEESHAERIAKLEDTLRGLSTPATPPLVGADPLSGAGNMTGPGTEANDSGAAGGESGTSAAVDPNASAGMPQAEPIPPNA